MITKNPFSKNRESKFFGKPIEYFVVGSLVSRTIKKRYAGSIYKQETDEVKLVRTIVEKLVLSNSLERFLQPNYEVKVIHDQALGMFMSPD